jgi:glycerol-3-phosphate dehydrogenase
MAQALKQKGKRMEIRRINVIGAGIMGRGIARVAATAGFEARYDYTDGRSE